MNNSKSFPKGTERNLMLAQHLAESSGTKLHTSAAAKDPFSSKMQSRGHCTMLQIIAESRKRPGLGFFWFEQVGRRTPDEAKVKMSKQLIQFITLK